MKHNQNRLLTLAVALAVGSVTGNAFAQETCTGPTLETVVGANAVACGTFATAFGPNAAAFGFSLLHPAPAPLRSATE